MRKADTVDIYQSLAAGGRAGAIWTLGHGGDLNAKLVRFPAGGVGKHVDEEVDGQEHPLRAGTAAFVSKGARRSTRSGSGDFAYLTVHCRRRPPRIVGPS